MRSQINFDQQTKEDALSQVLAATDQARAQLVDKSWSFRRKNGQKVIVRDVLAKVAKWVNHFKDVGDIAVQYDPVHAALPWAGIRFLLKVSHAHHPPEGVTLTSQQVAVGDFDTCNRLLESTLHIAECICRNAVVESLVNGSSSPTAAELSRALVKLYASILVYLAKARAYYRQNTPSESAP